MSIEVIPAIDLLEGQCVRLYQGDYDRSQVFSDNPVEVARQWVAQGATRLHVVDLDGAKQGHPVNQEAIAAIARAVNIPVQVGGGLRERDSVARVLETGARRVILGTVAVEQPQLVARVAAEFPQQIWVGIDAREGQVATRGWLETASTSAVDLAGHLAAVGIAGIVYTDIHRDGTLSGPNLPALRELVATTSLPVIASGGIGSLTHLLSLLALAPQGVVGAIVGRALYSGNVDLSEAIAAVGSGRWQDVPPDTGFSTFA